MTKRCIGCGAVLQNTDKKKNGYTPKLENKYCMRCFRLTNYNDLTETITEKDNDKIITVINNSSTFSFFLIDATNITKEAISIYQNIKTRKCLLLTKIDLLPANITVNNYINKFKNIYNIKEEVYPLSSIKKVNVSKILKMMDNLNIKKAYILGCTNAGKSTLINTMLNNKTITTSRIPNTTLDFINLYIEDKILTDTPGFVTTTTPFITDKKYYKKIDYKERIKTITYQTKEKASLVLEENYRFSEKKRAFYEENIGKSFTFNVQFQRWIKQNVGKTYGDSIEAYKEIVKQKKKIKPEIDKQFEYNTYIRDFFLDNEGLSLNDAIKCWKYKKSLPGSHKYEKEDLIAIK